MSVICCLELQDRFPWLECRILEAVDTSGPSAVTCEVVPWNPILQKPSISIGFWPCQVARCALSRHLNATPALAELPGDFPRKLLRQFNLFETVSGELVHRPKAGIPCAPSVEWEHILQRFSCLLASEVRILVLCVSFSNTFQPSCTVERQIG